MKHFAGQARTWGDLESVIEQELVGVANFRESDINDRFGNEGSFRKLQKKL